MTMPSASKLPHISPTLLQKLQECLLQVAFDTDPNYRAATIKGVAARLGTAAHRVLEAISKGAISDVVDWDAAFEGLWQREIGSQEQQVLATPHERHFGPARTWPYYGMQRAKLKRLAHHLWVQQRQRSFSQKASHDFSTTEHHYRAFEGRMVGTADVIRREQDHLIIEDYKTGSVTEVDAATGLVNPRSSYQQQLLLYAAMHHDVTGVWPTHGRLIPLEGELVEIRIDAQQATDLTAQALALLDMYNDLVGSGITQETLAKPEPITCRWCPYHGRCNPLWEHILSTWDWKKHSVECLVLTATQRQNNEIVADLQVMRGSVSPGRYKLAAMPSMYSQRLLDAVGQIVRISQLERHEHRLHTTSMSIVWLPPFDRTDTQRPQQ